MKLQQQPNHWSCLPTAFAMMLNVDVSEIIDFCGHDGSEKVFTIPRDEFEAKSLGYVVYRDSLSRRSFHIQEMVDYCYTKGVAVIEILPELVSSNGSQSYRIPDCGRFKKYLNTANGILIGEINDKAHAVAWYNRLVYDPNGTQYELDGNFTIWSFYVLCPIILPKQKSAEKIPQEGLSPLY